MGLGKIFVRTPKSTGNAASHDTQTAGFDHRKDQLLGSVSHQLRAPVSSMLGCTELLLDGSVGAMTVEQRMMLLRVDREGRRLQRHVEDLVTLSEIAAGDFLIQSTEINLTAIVRRAIEIATPCLIERRLALHVHMNRKPVMIKGDEDQLERVVVGLLQHAVAVSPEGGTVNVALSHEGDDCVLTVGETGLAITEGGRDAGDTSLFRAAETEQPCIPVTALSLRVATSIVEIHEGSIAVESHTGNGTTITVRLDAAGPLSA